ncbi:hypothetical protein [Iodidimonas nitroreducens]|uniref:hypothetical protein n=1 Tax=Iodidimonas nitroreducens TaxID=1236968 RepID=UPI001267F46D|nr:hypothetical protein [Iodidimonas nitroreducens]
MREDQNPALFSGVAPDFFRYSGPIFFVIPGLTRNPFFGVLSPSRGGFRVKPGMTIFVGRGDEKGGSPPGVTNLYQTQTPHVIPDAGQTEGVRR